MAENDGESENLTYSIMTTSDTVYELFCEVCADFDKHLQAEGYCIDCYDYLCKDCVNAHRKQRALRSHVVQTKSQMPRQKPTPPPSSSPPPALAKSSTASTTETCDLHQDRLIEYYCKDDDTLVCPVCLVDHRHCRAVDHISKLTDHLLDSQRYQQFTASLTTLERKCKDVIQNANDNTIKANKFCTDVSSDLQKLLKTVTQAFDKFDNDIKLQTGTIKSDDLKKIKDIDDKGKNVLSEVDKIFTELRELENKNQLGQLLVRMIKLEGRVQALHDDLNEAVCNNTVVTYRFVPGTAEQYVLDNPESFGKLAVQDTGSNPTPGPSEMTRKQLQDDIMVQKALITGQLNNMKYLDKEKSKLEEQNNSLNNKLAVTKSEYVRLKLESQTQQKQDRSTINNLQSELKNLRSKFDQTCEANVKEVKNLNSEITDLGSQHEAVIKECYDLKMQLKQSQETLDNVIKNLDNANRKISDLEVNATKVGDISARTESDTRITRPDITGSALLPDKKMILADNNNNKIKLLDLQTSKVTSELTASRPWDVAIITEDQVAVTLHDARKIAFVKVTTVLTLDRKISVDGYCTGIVHNNGKLIVALREPVKIEIMGLDGKVEKRIECSNMFKKPSHIVLSLGHNAIYITETTGHCVKRLSLDGKLEDVYEDRQLECPTGVIVDHQGRVIVCGAVSGNIHLLTPDLTKIKLLVCGLSYPTSLTLCYNTERLYIGKLNDYSISVYQLSK